MISGSSRKTVARQVAFLVDTAADNGAVLEGNYKKEGGLARGRLLDFCSS
jgi:hypothetical protein